ncbi:hypothetical protein AUJ46_04470 [Candidatus Peregrinibacteria bacterium CG1_02_54_53]|nr:MAG: hypothetical protein AUJ46_04470 [Candidatus Peregrinibacteria bacterium CG1_02_54_53]
MADLSLFKYGDIEKILKQAGALRLSAKARERLECLLYYFAHNRNASGTARHFGISRATFYNWLHKADFNNLCSLENCSTAPRHVPEPITDKRTVALIRRHRMSDPLIGKEKLSAHLRSAHNIHLSASTVGRVIHRNCFYFANTPAHRSKRHGHHSHEKTGWRHGWRLAVAIVLTVAASFITNIQSTYALQGTSYQLDPASPDQIIGNDLEGSSFILQDGGSIDISQQLEGSSYQITASPAQSSSSSSDQPASATSTSPSGTTGGGRRGIPSVAQPSTETDSEPSTTPLSEQADAVPVFGQSITVPSSLALPATVSPTSVHPDTATKYRAPAAPPTDEQVSDTVVHEAAPTAPVVPPAIQESFDTIAGMTAIILMTLAGILGHVWFVVLRQRQGLQGILRSMADIFRRIFLPSILFCVLSTTFWWNASPVRAATVPLTQWYQGHLLDSSGNAVTTAVTIRFSQWKSADFTASDLTGTGSINTTATNYMSWMEEHTVTPSSNGAFAVELGSVNALPDLSTLDPSVLQSLYL